MPSFSAWYDACVLKTFKITAYYSPLENQNFYVQGSREADKLLNGEGTHGASGKPVFNGMIAAPLSYSFGTRIYIPGRGIGQIEDRGGAIVVSGERNEVYDRLDLWAGRGEKGLANALRFGVKYLDAYICPAGVGGDTLGFPFSSLPTEEKLPTTLWEVDLIPGQVSRWTPILQKYLKRLGYLKDVTESTRYGEQTTQAVCAFQQTYMGISSESKRCGRFGKQTRAALYMKIKNLSDDTDIIPPVVKDSTSIVTSPVANVHGDALFAQGGEFYRYQIGPLAPGENSKDVRILQRKLQWLGYYSQKNQITGIYDAQTIRAVYAFQVAYGLISDQTDSSVYGYFGPKTRKQLNDV